MTFAAGHICMFAIKSEGSFIVIKSRGFPVFRIMTPGTICRPAGGKLPPVVIAVTFGTVAGKGGKDLPGAACCILPEMTGSATHSGVCTRECEACRAMVKGHHRPAVHRMTSGTNLTRIVLLADQIAMDILMAIAACRTYFSETPPLLLPVAFETRCRQVSPFQGERTGIMLFNCVAEIPEPARIMANGTVLLLSIPDELPLMVITVTAYALFMRNGIGQLSLMAQLAVDDHMSAFKGKSCLVMIKLLKSLNHLE